MRPTHYRKKDLNARQYKAIAMLSVGQTYARAAEAAGVKTGTIKLWMSNEKFSNEVRNTSERIREAFQARIFALAQNGAAIVNEMMSSDQNLDRRAEGAKIAIGSAVRLLSRYKELQIDGYAPTVPMVVFPPGTTMPWANKSLPESETIDVEADVVESDDGTEGSE